MSILFYVVREKMQNSNVLLDWVKTMGKYGKIIAMIGSISHGRHNAGKDYLCCLCRIETRTIVIIIMYICCTIHYKICSHIPNTNILKFPQIN